MALGDRARRGQRGLALLRAVVAHADRADRGRLLAIPAAGHRDRAWSAVQRCPRVIAEHRASEGTALARAHHEQVGSVLFGLLMQPTTGRGRDDADEPRAHPGGRALALQELIGGVALVLQQPVGQHVRRVRRSCMDVGEHQLRPGIRKARGEGDRVAAVGPSVNSHEHVLEHLHLPLLVMREPWRIALSLSAAGGGAVRPLPTRRAGRAPAGPRSAPAARRFPGAPETAGRR